MLDLRSWSLDNWGEDLLLMPNNGRQTETGGKLYHWDATNGVAQRAVEVTAAPTGRFMYVSPEDRHVIVLGAGGDDLAVQWCDQGDFTNWTQSATTTADDRRLLHGSKFRAAIRTRGGALLWTDTSLYLIQFIASADFAFGIHRVGNADICGPAACCEVSGRVYWMAPSGFYMYDGRIVKLECTLQQTIFDNFNFDQNEKVVAAPNEQWNSIRFHYVGMDADEPEISRYVDFNYTENTWIPGMSDGGMQVLAWVDRGLFNSPVSIDQDGFLYYHEVGADADGAAMQAFIESGDFDIGDGDEVMLSKGYISDFILDGECQVTQKSRLYPGAPQRIKGPDTITAATELKKSRIRGRQMAVRFSSDTLGAHWRVGVQRFDVQPDGKR